MQGNSKTSNVHDLVCSLSQENLISVKIFYDNTNINKVNYLSSYNDGNDIKLTNISVQVNLTTDYGVEHQIDLPTEDFDISLYVSGYENPQIKVIPKDNQNKTTVMIGMSNTNKKELFQAQKPRDIKTSTENTLCQVRKHKWALSPPLTHENVFPQRVCTRCNKTQEKYRNRWYNVESDEYKKILTDFDRPSVAFSEKEWVTFSTDKSGNIIAPKNLKKIIISQLNKGIEATITFSGKRDRTCIFPGTIDHGIDTSQIQFKNGIYCSKGYDHIWFENRFVIPRSTPGN